MKLKKLTPQELIKIEGGNSIEIQLPDGNGGYYDDGSGQGCIPYPKFPFRK